MTLSLRGIQYICKSFGDTNLCCINTGLSWYTSKEGEEDIYETGGTTQIVGRLALGICDSLTMTDPDRGTFTKAQLDEANESTVTILDAKSIKDHDEPTEDQWCFIACEDHKDQTTCETYGCHWWSIGGIGGCHTNLPTCEELDNEPDCTRYKCFYIRGKCRSVDQPELCYWIDSKGGPTALTVSDIYEIADAYSLDSPPPGDPPWTFVPTLKNVYGVLDYFLGFDGDPLTGCDYYEG